jgi:hypothetical protein
VTAFELKQGQAPSLLLRFSSFFRFISPCPITKGREKTDSKGFAYEILTWKDQFNPF